MDIKQIRYFLSLSDTYNFTSAAEAHGISQPALTKAIQRLEDDVGGLLIHRDGKHTRLSELGRKLRQEFATIAESEERARQIAADHLDEGVSQLRLGISNSLGPRLFVDFLGAFSARHPAIRLVIHPVQTETTQEHILSGMLDACFCARPGKPNHKIKTIGLFTERLMVAVSPDHPLAEREHVTLKDLEGERYFDRLNCEFRPTFVEEVERLGLSISTPVQSDREDWIQQMVAAGHGVTSLAEYSRVVPGLELRPIEGVNLSREVSLISILGSTAAKSVHALEEMAQCYGWEGALK